MSFHLCWQNFIKALPAYDALTGCDYTVSFFKKGEVRPLKLLQKDDEAQIVLSENTISKIEGYLCKIYPSKHICKASDSRKNISEEI